MTPPPFPDSWRIAYDLNRDRVVIPHADEEAAHRAALTKSRLLGIEVAVLPPDGWVEAGRP